MSESIVRMPPLPSGLPSIAKAKLPAIYESAKTALAECSRVDECKDWADKAEALASYAKQAGDESLRKTADRIQARAIQRCGELLKEIRPKHGQGGGRPSKQPETTSGRHRPDVSLPPTRSEAAREAGLSERQQKTALRVASVPKDEFERAVESPDPPTVTQLAEQGKKSAPKPLFDLNGRDPHDFQACTAMLGLLRDVRTFALRTDPKAVIRGASPSERSRFSEQIPELLGWLNELLVEAQERK